MPENAPPPDEQSLRAFLLGTLPPGRVEDVRGWLETDPGAAERLRRVRAGDRLTDALAGDTADDPDTRAAVERVARGVADALRAGVSAAAAASGATVPQLSPPVPDDTRDRPPDRLGGYTPVRELGRGGMGVVYEAEDARLGRRVAVKVLGPALARRADARARFLREARAGAAVEHDNVVPILHVGEEGEAPFIVMPLLRGEPLDARLRRDGALASGEVARVGRDVARGLAAAHARGLVHRDVKPANVWLDADTGRARVLDFGLARSGDAADALTEAGALQGTPAYMAPEQVDGRPATPRSDLFALGAVLYECATGRRAFAGPTLTAILRAVADHRPAPPHEINPDVPAALSALIAHLLSKDPDDRPASAADVAGALAVAGEAAAAAPTTTAGPTRPGRRPWRVRVAAGAALAAVLVTGVCVGTRPRSGEGDSAEGVKPVVPDVVVTPPPIRYRGKVDVLVERTVAGSIRLLRLDEPGALPLNPDDKFRIEGELDPPAYLYVVWVDPGHDVTPVYPWNAAAGWGSRPPAEPPVSRVSLPPNKGDTYKAPPSPPGVATMVLFARPTPLDAPDGVVEGWFKDLPDLPLPPGGAGGAVWFDDYAEVKDPLRLRTFRVEESADPFARWQGRLQQSLGPKAAFQSAVSFARTGGK